MSKYYKHRDFISLQEHFKVIIESIKESTTLARESMEKRLEGMNEFRDALKDQTSKFITRAEHEDLKRAFVELKIEMDKRPTWWITLLFIIITSLLSIIGNNLLK